MMRFKDSIAENEIFVPLLDWPADQLRNPYWFNHGSGECIQTEKHHAHAFAVHPELIGFTYEDHLAFEHDKLTERVRWTMDYTTAIFARGWARIDVGQPGTIAVIAGSVEWADAAIAQGVRLANEPITTLVAFVITGRTHIVPEDTWQRFQLSGDNVGIALKYGLRRWAKPRLHRADGAERSTSKMRPVDSGPLKDLDPETLAMIFGLDAARVETRPNKASCPFGFSA